MLAPQKVGDSVRAVLGAGHRQDTRAGWGKMPRAPRPSWEQALPWGLQRCPVYRRVCGESIRSTGARNTPRLTAPRLRRGWITRSLAPKAGFLQVGVGCRGFLLGFHNTHKLMCILLCTHQVLYNEFLKLSLLFFFETGSCSLAQGRVHWSHLSSPQPQPLPAQGILLPKPSK